MSPTEIRTDNLESITGIGPDAREWLAENFDVRTFAALADLSVEELVSRAKAENKPWVRWAKDWPADAAKKAADLEAEVQPRQPEPTSARQKSSASPQIAPSEESSAAKPNSTLREIDGWDTLALYFIEFQCRQAPGQRAELRTKVVFEGPGDQAQTILPGVDLDRACQWISEHASMIDMARVEMDALPVSETTSTGTSPQSMSVSQLRFFQPAGTTSPLFSYSRERPKIRMVRANRPFDLEVLLEGSASQVTGNDRIPTSVRLLVKDWDSEAFTRLGDVRPRAIEGQLAYSALLSAVRLPRGRYHLRVLAFGHPEPVILGSMEIKMLSVW